MDARRASVALERFSSARFTGPNPLSAIRTVGEFRPRTVEWLTEPASGHCSADRAGGPPGPAPGRVRRRF